MWASRRVVLKTIASSVPKCLQMVDWCPRDDDQRVVRSPRTLRKRREFGS